MIPTSHKQTYIDLLIQYQPQLIKTEAEYQRALTIVEGMMSSTLTAAETTFFELLVLLIETYEQYHYPMNESTPVATLESLMHEFDLDPTSLVEVFGSLELVEEVIHSQQEISPSQAKSLAKFFNNLSPALSLTDSNFQ